VPLDKELLAILACPQCKGTVYLSETGAGIICGQCRLLYPINDGIPVMLSEEAEEL
jgi:uncharacterized protein YbaR (Trm112 family)